MRLTKPSESEYKMKIQGREDKIVWYKFRKELPEVTPPRPKEDRAPLRAEAKAAQSIVSSPPDAPKTTQTIWTPAPAIAPAPLDSPNLIAVKLPDPPPRQIVVPDAPLVRPEPLQAADLKAVIPSKPFVEPPATAPKPPAVKTLLADDAPLLQPAAVRPTQLAIAHLPPKPFVAPAAASRRFIEKTIATLDAPQIAATTAPGSPIAALSGAKLPPRPFTAPPVARAAGRGTDLSAALDMPANSTDLNVAIVGLNPVEKMASLPSASSPGAFSAGPVVRPTGATSEGGGTGLSVPDLFVRGARDKKPDLIAQARLSPTSEENLRAAMRSGEAVMTVHVPAGPAALPRSTATRVSGAPDPRFNGREVFMMAIQMPQLTSYSGSWLMWYADHTLREAGLAPIAPPEAHRKVDPKYIASAVSERVEGRVTLACVIDKTGKVSAVELLRGIDDRLNLSAQQALSKWEFYPATRNGDPVDVDVVVEIPFKLEPRIERR